MKHELKTLPRYFSRVLSYEKQFEIRLNDRDFQVGDEVVLREFENGYTGRQVSHSISYVTDFEQKPGWVVFGLGERLFATTAFPSHGTMGEEEKKP